MVSNLDIKYLVSYFKDLNYFDCVDTPSRVCLYAHSMADMIEELIDENIKLQSENAHLKFKLERNNRGYI